MFKLISTKFPSHHNGHRPSDKSTQSKINFLISQPKRNIVGTQKNHLLMAEKKITFLPKKKFA